MIPVHIKTVNGRAGEMAGVKCLDKHKDQGSDPSTQGSRAQWHVKGRQRQEDPWGLQNS